MGFNCQQATVHFRGRNYEAWFTEEIPTSVGPWKFFGLPGLILEVKDSQNRVYFYAQKIEIPPKTPSTYHLSKFEYDGINLIDLGT